MFFQDALLEKTQNPSRHMPNEAEISTQISAVGAQQHMLLKSVVILMRTRALVYVSEIIFEKMSILLKKMKNQKNLVF